MTEATRTAFISSKGGSGKTVTSSALGTFLASIGFKVLLVDTDAATNGMTLLFLEQLLNVKRQRSSTTGVLKTGIFDTSFNQPPEILKIDRTLNFLPATYSMAQTENVEFEQFRSALRSVLQVHAQEYDFVLLDAQAGADTFAHITAELADQCIIVSEYDPVS